MKTTTQNRLLKEIKKIESQGGNTRSVIKALTSGNESTAQKFLSGIKVSNNTIRRKRRK